MKRMAFHDENKFLKCPQFEWQENKFSNQKLNNIKLAKMPIKLILKLSLSYKNND